MGRGEAQGDLWPESTHSSRKLSDTWWMGQRSPLRSAISKHLARGGLNDVGGRLAAPGSDCGV